MNATIGIWYPPSAGVGRFLLDGQLFTNPPFNVTTMKFPPLADQHCGNCRYVRCGECHRHAPRIGHRGSEWPAVNSDDWCGQWVAVEASDG